jgi:PLAC8 family
MKATPQAAMTAAGNGSTISVVAPCDMEAGYTFIAQTPSGDDMPVTVPEGGVREGEVFLCRSNSPIGSFSNLTELTPLMINRIGQVPKAGAWKDEWWDCFRFGIFHVSLWNACLCPQLLAAQVMTRLKLDWLADPAENDNPRTFNRVLLIVCLYWIVSTLTAPPSPAVAVLDVVDTGTGEEMQLEIDEDPPHQRLLTLVVYHAVTISFSLYTLFIFTKLRHQVRRLDNIAVHPLTNSCISFPGGSRDPIENVALEDCCMSFWCGCCSVAQMARQTTDYAQEPAACCSSTGLLIRTPTATTTLSALSNGKFFPKTRTDDVYLV